MVTEEKNIQAIEEYFLCQSTGLQLGDQCGETPDVRLNILRSLYTTSIILQGLVPVAVLVFVAKCTCTNRKASSNRSWTPIIKVSFIVCIRDWLFLINSLIKPFQCQLLEWLELFDIATTYTDYLYTCMYYMFAMYTFISLYCSSEYTCLVVMLPHPRAHNEHTNSRTRSLIMHSHPHLVLHHNGVPKNPSDYSMCVCVYWQYYMTWKQMWSAKWLKLKWSWPTNMYIILHYCTIALVLLD